MMEDKNMKEYNLSNPSVEEEERMIQDSIDAEYEMRKREEDEYYRAMEEDYYRYLAMEEDYYRYRVMEEDFYRAMEEEQARLEE